jgi:2-polyprenyl-3-methyl-5-hydroxy-6-metoxy-1,4-benzoquinol methylase
MNEFVKCPLCGSQHLKIMKGYEKDTIVRCNDCTFVFCKKIPADAELQKYYEGYPSFQTVSDVTIKRYNQLLDELEKFRVNNTIIDVGCGEGFFLEQAVKRGWNAYGTEYAEQYIETCRKKNINMAPGKFEPENYSPRFFDALISIEVIEHINYPSAEVKNFSEAVRSGGIVYLTTPNFNSISRRMLKEKWNVISYPEHLTYFTPKTITKIFDSNGFRMQKIKTTGISIGRLKVSMGKKKINSAAENISRVKDEKLREGIEKNIFLRLIKAFINFLLTVSGTGDTLKAYFIKR